MSQVRSPIRPSRYNPMRSTLDGARRQGLPQSGLLGKWLAPGLVDSTGLSISDKPNIDPDLWSIFFIIDGETVTKRADADIWTLAFASSFLNTGTMIGRADYFLALYSIDTPDTTLLKALQYARFSTEPLYLEAEQLYLDSEAIYIGAPA